MCVLVQVKNSVKTIGVAGGVVGGALGSVAGPAGAVAGASAVKKLPPHSPLL